LYVQRGKKNRIVSFALNALQDGLLEVPLNLLPALVSGRLTVQVQQATEIKLRLFEQLDFSDVDVLQRVDALGSLLDISSDSLWDQLGGQLTQSAVASLPRHDVHHLLPDRPNLRALRVRGLLDLIRSAFGETDGEQSEQVIVGGLDGDVGLNEGLPFTDEGAKFVGGEVKAVEVGQAVFALNLIDTELDLAEGVFFIFLQIG